MKKQTRKVGVAGGFINQMMGNNQSVPVVGEGATILMYSDRHAYEVIEVSDGGSKCVIRAMDSKNVGECYGDERYTYTSNPKGETSTIEWSEKKQCWGRAWTQVEIIKVLQNKLIKEYSYDWSNNLPVPYKELIDGESNGIYTKLKLVKGVTKEYKNFSKVSIIFGVMEEYRDPSF
jgi:hypothetical protein